MIDLSFSEAPADFLLITLVLGGGAAFLVGRAVAVTWRGLPSLLTYLVLLDCAVRFIHFALAHDTLLAPLSFAIDLLVLVAAGGIGFRLTRAAQISRQYHWLYRRTGPLTWARRDHETP